MAIVERRGGVSPLTDVIANSKYKYEVNSVTSENRWNLMARALPLHQLLNYEPARVLREVFNNTEKDGEVVFAKTPDPEPKDVGFVAQRLVQVLFEGRPTKVLSILTKVVVPEYQDHNIGTELAIEAIQRLAPDYVTGRTQNPFVIRAYERIEEFKEIIPIAKSYTPRMQLLLALTFGSEGVAEVDFKNGLCRGVYPSGESRTFVLDKASERVLEIYKIMTGPRIGAILENGDAIRYLAVRDRRIRSHLLERDRGLEDSDKSMDINVGGLQGPSEKYPVPSSAFKMSRLSAFLNRLLFRSTTPVH